LCLALPLAVACQLTSADQVSRSPSVARGTGGTPGRDVASADDLAFDRPSTYPDGPDAPSIDTEAVGYDGAIDGPVPAVDAGVPVDTAADLAGEIDGDIARDTEASCDAQPFCDRGR
jgi:hypothetical protein